MEIFVRQDGHETGPSTSDEVEELAGVGKIIPYDLLCNDSGSIGLDAKSKFASKGVCVMTSRIQRLVAIEISLGVSFVLAAVSGGLTFYPTGVVIQRLAYDWIAMIVLIAAFGSCAVSSALVAELVKFKRKSDAVLFLLSLGIAWFAISAFANAPDEFSISGRSVAVVIYPIYLWLGFLVATAVFGLTRTQRRVESSNRVI